MYNMSKDIVITPRIRKSGTPKSKNDLHAVFHLPLSERVIKEYTCKVFFRAGVTRPGTLYITTNNLCYESDYFFGTKREVLSFEKITSYKINVEKNHVIIKYRKKSKIFEVSVEDLAECTTQLALIFKNKDRRKKSQRNCRVRSLSSDSDEMEPTIEEWDEIIASQTKSLVFNAGDIIMEAGKLYNCVWQVNSGTVSIEKQDKNSTSTQKVGIAGEGYLFGEVPFLSEKQALTSVIALDDVEVYVTSKNALEELYKRESLIIVKFYHYLCATLAGRVVEAKTQIKPNHRNSIHALQTKLSY